MSSENELTIPPIAREDPNSSEILRVWIANQGQHVSLRAGIWDDPAFWGIMLADLARHIVNSYEHAGAPDRQKALERIKLAFEVELASPTDNDLSGSIC